MFTHAIVSNNSGAYFKGLSGNTAFTYELDDALMLRSEEICNILMANHESLDTENFSAISVDPRTAVLVNSDEPYAIICENRNQLVACKEKLATQWTGYDVLLKVSNVPAHMGEIKFLDWLD